MLIDQHVYEQLEQAGFTHDQIEKYKKCMFTEEKLKNLMEIKEHHVLADFIDFSDFEAMSVSQLNIMLKLIQENSDGWIRKERLEKKRREFMNDQSSSRIVIINAEHWTRDYLTPELFQYVESLSVGFADEYNCEAIVLQEVRGASIDNVWEEIRKIPRETDRLFFSDKENMLFEISFYNEEYCALYLDTRNAEVLAQYSPHELLELAKKDPDRNIRNHYESLENIKRDDRRKNDRIKGLKDIVRHLDSLDAKEIDSSILNYSNLCFLTQKMASKGPNALKIFLKEYDCMASDDFYYLNAEGNIEMIDEERLDTLICEIDSLQEFENMRTIEHSKKHISRLGKYEKDALISSCKYSSWLNNDEYDYTDYPFNFIKCEKKFDLMNYMERGNWAIRDGFIYENLAFVQQVNGGDEFLTLIKTGTQWIPFESISVEDTIKSGNFYQLIDDLEQRGQNQINKELMRKEKSKTRNDRDL